MPTLLPASSVPSPFVSGGIASYSTDDVPPVAMTILSGSQSPVVSSAFNRNQARADYSTRYASGGNCIGEGLALSIVSGLTMRCAPGIAVGDGILWLKANYDLVLSASQPRIWLWAKKAASTSSDPAGLTVYPTLTTTPPTDAVCLLGSCSTDGGGIVVGSIDTSGVVYSKSGELWRSTGDTGLPSDSPSSSWRGYTQTTGGLWYWDGLMHRPVTNFLALTKTTIPVGFTECVPSGYESSVYGAFSVPGSLVVKGLLRATS
jgi:hypothetical protein